MKCPQCNTELPDSAIFCVQCGSTIRQPTFSYLPMGTPAWPNEQLKSTQYRMAPLESTQSIVPSEASSKVSSSAASSKKTRLGVPAIIGLCILSILIGGGLTFGILYINGQRLAIGPQPALKPLQLPTQSASSSTPASGTPTVFHTINSTDLGISVKYPSDWVTDPAQKSATSAFLGIHPQQQQTGIYLAIERYTPSGSAKIANTSTINQFNLSQFQNQQNISNFQVIAPASAKRTIGGVQWDEQDATFSNANNVSFHLTTIAVQYKKLYYDIVFYSPASTYDATVQNYIVPMLNSFKFS
jgi:zinc-ribbon domain